jgi:pilus assembly protein CpaC
MFKDRKNPACTIPRAALVAAAIALSTLAMSMACGAQAATVASVPEVATVSNLGVSPIPGASGSISRVTSGAEMLHVIVGHSLFLNTRSRLRRVYVADPSILNSVTLSPNQIVVTAMASGISSLILLDEAGQAQSYVVSSDLDVSGLRTAMSEAMRGEAVNIEGNGDRVILSGKVDSDAQADTAVKLAGLYSKDIENVMTVAPDHPKQVKLKVRILEVDRSKANQYGINLFNPGGNTSFLASTSTSQYATSSVLSGGSTGGVTLTTSDPLNFLLYSSKLNLGATVKDLESKQVLQILAEPTITAISGKTANFLSGGEFPFPIVQPGGAGSAPVVTISFRQYGVKVEFTPVVSEDGVIRLKVAPEVSSLDYTNSVTIGGFTVPALSTRRAETEVELRSDQSFAISGLLDQRTTDIMSKMPGAASIPILGALFKSKNVNHSNTELIVIVTPTLVDPLTNKADLAQPELPIPTLNSGAFDKSLGKDLNPAPAAPPINPPQPPANDQVPATTPSSTPVPPPVSEPAKTTTPALAPPSTAASVSEPAKTATPAQAPKSTVALVSEPAKNAAPAQAPKSTVAPVSEPAKTAAPAQAPKSTVALVSEPAKTATPAQAPKSTVALVSEPAKTAAPAQAPPSSTAPAAPKPATVPAATTAATTTSVQPPSSVLAKGASQSTSPSSSAGAAAPGIATPPTVASSESPRRYVFDNPTATAPASGKPAAEPEPPARSMVVQIMALSSKEDAELMAVALKRQGYDVAINHDPVDALLHLEVGPFSSKTDAEAVRQRLLLDGYNATIR